MLKILVIEDHALVREGIVRIVQQLDEPVSLFEAANGDDALTWLEREPDLDLVTLDLALPGVDGITWLTAQRKRFPAVPIVVVSAYDDAQTVKRVMKAGAAGFVSKASTAEQMLGAMRRVLMGEIVEPSSHAPTPLGVDTPTHPPVTERAKDLGLSPRQAEVLGLMAKGKSNRDIAQLLGLTEGTVKIHVTAVFKALGVNSRTQALVALQRHKIRL